MTSRDVRIDTLRGLACLALVFFHSVGIPSTGFRVGHGWLRGFNDFLALIRMPLFTFLSGYVFAIRPYVSGQTKAYLKGKMRRLIFPLLFVGTIFAVLQSLMPGANSAVDKWYLLHIVPVGHFWYLESLYLIFLFIIPLTKLHILNSAIGTLSVAGVFLVLTIWQPYPSYFGLKGFVYLMPFFLIGYMIRRYFFTFHFNRMLAASALILLLLSAVFFDYGWVRSLPAMLVGIAFCLLIYYLRLEISMFAGIGRYSYSIFIYHVFFTAAARIFTEFIIDGYVFYKVLICTFFGILGPVVLYKVFHNIAILRPFAFGEAYISKE